MISCCPKSVHPSSRTNLLKSQSQARRPTDQTAAAFESLLLPPCCSAAVSRSRDAAVTHTPPSTCIRRFASGAEGAHVEMSAHQVTTSAPLPRRPPTHSAPAGPDVRRRSHQRRGSGRTTRADGLVLEWRRAVTLHGCAASVGHRGAPPLAPPRRIHAISSAPPIVSRSRTDARVRTGTEHTAVQKSHRYVHDQQYRSTIRKGGGEAPRRPGAVGRARREFVSDRLRIHGAVAPLTRDGGSSTSTRFSMILTRSDSRDHPSGSADSDPGDGGGRVRSSALHLPLVLKPTEGISDTFHCNGDHV